MKKHFLFTGIVALLLTLIIGYISYRENNRLQYADSGFAQTHDHIGSKITSNDNWTYQETFDGVPAAPSTALLPKYYDFVSTHRSHPSWHDGNPSHREGVHGTFPADHGPNCEPPPNWANPQNQPSVGKNQHIVETSHRSNATNPESSFFICNGHLMSSMGDVDGYSVSTFYPRQEFDFSQIGTKPGVLEFEASITWQNRNWWEVLIVPKEQIQLGAAQHWLPISETYPKDRIALIFDGGRKIEVGTGQTPPAGIVSIQCCEHNAWKYPWIGGEPEDPALLDPRIRRKHRVEFYNNEIHWSVEKRDGTYHTEVTKVPSGLPFKKGLVLFKTHAYTPNKDGIHHRHTVHWDNIRWTGSLQPRFEAYEADRLVKLYTNGSRPIGDKDSVTITIPSVKQNPVLVGQVGGGMHGQVLVRINGGNPIEIRPHSFKSSEGGCVYEGWHTFYVPIQSSLLKQGVNQFEWVVGPRNSCASSGNWDGYAIKALEVQFHSGVVMQPTPRPTSIVTQIPTSTPIIPTPTVIPTPTSLSTVRPSASVTALPTSTTSSANQVIITAGGESALGGAPEIVISRMAQGARVEDQRVLIDADIKRGELKNYTVSFSAPVTISSLRTYFTNDFCIWAQGVNGQWGCEGGIDRNVRVQKITIGNTSYLMNNSKVYSVGSWRSSDGCTPGFKESDWLMCNGYFEWR